MEELDHTEERKPIEGSFEMTEQFIFTEYLDAEFGSNTPNSKAPITIHLRSR